jgi:hypothetical protein
MLNKLKIIAQSRKSKKVPVLQKLIDQVVLVINTAIEEANYGE